jgi:hypothetical protein
MLAEESIIEPDFGCLQRMPDEMGFWSEREFRYPGEFRKRDCCLSLGEELGFELRVWASGSPPQRVGCSSLWDSLPANPQTAGWLKQPAAHWSSQEWGSVSSET